MTDIAKILNDAADHMERVGLHKGAFFKDHYDITDSPCCTLGAIRYASGYTSNYGNVIEYNRAVNAFRKALPGGRGVDNVPDWNDLPSRRKGQVVERLRKAAALHE